MSALEDELYFQMQAIGLEPIREYPAILGRKFRFDFALEEPMILIEVQGGTWSAGKMAHNSGTGIRRDCVKLNLAQLAGWKVLQFTSDMIRDGEALATLEKFMERDTCSANNVTTP